MSRLIPGLVIISLGFVWLFNNLGITSVAIGGIITTYWPSAPFAAPL